MSKICKVDNNCEANIAKEIQYIEKLDESINDLDFKLKEVLNELSSLQLKNRQRLKESMVSNIENRRLTENTIKYLNFYSIDVSQEDTSESVNDPSGEFTQTILYDVKNSSVLDTQILSITNEETSDSIINKSIEMILEHNFDNQLNPYKLNEKSVKLLEELDTKLKTYTLDHINDDLRRNNSNN